MQRAEVESKLQTFLADCRIRIEQKPMKAVLLAYLFGLATAILFKFILPLVLIALLVGGLLWFFSDEVNN